MIKNRNNLTAEEKVVFDRVFYQCRGAYMNRRESEDYAYEVIQNMRLDAERRKVQKPSNGQLRFPVEWSR